ncbi:MAG: flagellar hook-associated protein FlgL [Peptococcaceae bacterium]|nr:flagellar hook-associated protein FlgL [Peptococcaceae bacterium]
MRVTHNIMTNNLLRNLSGASGRMIDIQNKLSSNARINKPSDDPVGAETAMRLKSTLSSMEQWKQNVSEGKAYMQSVEGTLGGMIDMTHRLRELAIQGANGSSTPDDRLKIKSEVDQIIKQFEQSANTQFNGRYVFSGTRSDQEALVNADVVWNGSAYELSWGGNSKPVNIEVGPGLIIDISVNGESLYGIEPPGPGPAKTSQLLSTLYRLSDALENDDYDEINAVIGKDGSSDPCTLTEVTNNLLTIRSELGARNNRLENIEKQIEINILNVKQNLSAVVDIDIAEAIIQFKSIQNVYQAALAVGAQIIQPSLVDYMR